MPRNCGKEKENFGAVQDCGLDIRSVEIPMSISFTIDLEDPTARYEVDGRYVTMTRRILNLCKKHNRRATFFTVGKLAAAVPDLIREIAVDGHEIAYHSHAHVPLTREDPARFAQEARKDKDRFEQITGKQLVGFRAPAFSLTPGTLWALDILGELGFTYSSSIMPTRISRYGFPNAKHVPFHWPNGMLELPLPVAGRLGIPYLGGIYMYALPFALVKYFVAQSSPEEVLWTYTHPYDFDVEEKFIPTLHGSLFASIVLWLARLVAERKIERVLELGDGVTMREKSFSINQLAGKNFVAKSE
jgi:polysaccharide deacetylase family protein (PEP-CTERM system associated)